MYSDRGIALLKLGSVNLALRSWKLGAEGMGGHDKVCRSIARKIPWEIDRCWETARCSRVHRAANARDFFQNVVHRLEFEIVPASIYPGSRLFPLSWSEAKRST